jgi:hypothetical protein
MKKICIIIIVPWLLFAFASSCASYDDYDCDCQERIDEMERKADEIERRQREIEWQQRQLENEQRRLRFEEIH